MAITSPAAERSVLSAPWHQRLIPAGRPERGTPDGIDIAIAAACFVVFTLPVLVLGTGIGSDRAIALFGAAAVAPLIVRRKWPVAVVFAVAAVLFLAAVAGVRFTPWVSNTGPALGVAVLTLADRRSRRESLLVTGVALIAIAVSAPIAFHQYPEQDQDFVQLLIAAPAWLIGDALRTRREYRRDIVAQQQLRAIDTEQRIRAEERLRVSRDVHDLISHTLSMVAVRAGVARLLLDEQPDEARRALSAIEKASRSGLTELRQVLAQLREPGQYAGADEPGLAEITDLVDALRRDGPSVDYRVMGEPADYPPLLQSTVYRIAQEALTNIVKHARATHATVEIRYTPGELALVITDSGPAAHPAESPVGTGSGLGLIGMRERVSLFGGHFEAGTRPDGGFTVSAAFPLDNADHA
ncbi:sensor histidine kinase [Nocardia sp. NBC_01503]|uniref:sensor histidine kinase n=1 Tax=Nocardia sp. NBC_01503 TaxID=2975997 RepID=UPI002E7BAB1C|nr:sensor histidine kinase [Nocardia sp. NBC_01503]WTL31727.1 sensor histidine kinase [Nocardia sp. NBC_01503]